MTRIVLGVKQRPGGRCWYLMDCGTHYAIVSEPLNAEGARSVYSVGAKAYVLRRWRSM